MALTLAQYLDGVQNIEGIPVCRTLEDLKRTPLPALAVRPNGDVHVVTRPFSSKLWDPTTPLRKQI